MDKRKRLGQQLVALVANDGDASETRRHLAADGVWTVQLVDPVQNPFSPPDRLIGALAKLHVFALDQFERVAYLDADMAPGPAAAHVSLPDTLIDPGLCKDWVLCASTRSLDLFNTGAMVLRPNRGVHQALIGNLTRWGSYTGGDQGVINAAFDVHLRPPLPPPSSNPGQVAARLLAAGHRAPAGLLPHWFNGDTLMHLANGQWRAGREPWLVHYAGPCKPWHWQCAPVFPLDAVWRGVAQQPHVAASPFLVDLTRRVQRQSAASVVAALALGCWLWTRRRTSSAVRSSNATAGGSVVMAMAAPTLLLPVWLGLFVRSGPLFVDWLVPPLTTGTPLLPWAIAALWTWPLASMWYAAAAACCSSHVVGVRSDWPALAGLADAAFAGLCPSAIWLSHSGPIAFRVVVAISLILSRFLFFNWLLLAPTPIRLRLKNKER